MSLHICNHPISSDNCTAIFIGTIKCQFALPGLVRTDLPKQRDNIEKRLIQRLKNLDIHCQCQPSALLTQCNRKKEQVNFIIEIKVYYSNEIQDQLAAARWFARTGRALSKIIRGSLSLNAMYAGLSTNIKPSYLFELENAIGLYEQQTA